MNTKINSNRVTLCQLICRSKLVKQYDVRAEKKIQPFVPISIHAQLMTIQLRLEKKKIQRKFVFDSKIKPSKSVNIKKKKYN